MSDLVLPLAAPVAGACLFYWANRQLDGLRPGEAAGLLVLALLGGFVLVIAGIISAAVWLVLK